MFIVPGTLAEFAQGTLESGSLAGSGRRSRIFKPRNVPSIYNTCMPASIPFVRPNAGCFSPIFSSGTPAAGNAKCGGPTRSSGGTRKVTCCEPSASSSVSSDSATCFAILVQKHLRDAAAKPNGIDRADDSGDVVDQRCPEQSMPVADIACVALLRKPAPTPAPWTSRPNLPAISAGCRWDAIGQQRRPRSPWACEFIRPTTTPEPATSPCRPASVRAIPHHFRRSGRSAKAIRSTRK